MEDEKHVLPVDHGVAGLVLDALLARPHHARLGAQVVGIQNPLLRGDGGAELDDEVALAAGEPGPDPVPLVGLVEQFRVIIDRGAQFVQPDRVGAPGVVDRRVDDEPTVGGEARSRGGVADLVRQQFAGGDIPDADRVALCAVQIHAEQHPRPVVGDLEASEREELVALGFDVPIEKHLLAGDLDARGQLRRRPVVGRGEGGPAVDAVLAALDRASVVPPVAVSARHGEVGLQGAALDLLEDLLAKPLEMCGARLGVGVLRSQMRKDLRVVLGAQPLVRVLERIAMVAACGSAAVGNGRGDGCRGSGAW